MANLTNPGLSLSAAAGVMAGLLSGRAMGVAGSNSSAVPSAAAADYAVYQTVANAVMTELDTLLGAGFDTNLASNATPGVTVAISGAAGAAGVQSCGQQTKLHAMWGIAYSFFAGKSPSDTTATDYATIAGGIKAAYQEWLALFTADAS